MKTSLFSVLQGAGQGFAEYIQELENIIAEMQSRLNLDIAPTLHQTAASDGRLHTMIQFDYI